MGLHDWSEAAWRLVEPLPPLPSNRGKARTDDRGMVDGLFYVLRTGSRLCDLSEYYGP